MSHTSDLAAGQSVAAVLRAAVGAIREPKEPRAVFAAAASGDGFPIFEHADLRDPRWRQVVVRPGRGLGGRVIEERNAVALGDYLHDSSITGDYLPIVRAEGLRSMVCVPVEVERRVEALLYVAPRQARTVGSRLVEQTIRIAELAAVGIAQAQSGVALAARARRALRLDDREALRSVAETAAGLSAGADHRIPDPLTTRQLQVLDHLADGASNAELALRLAISEPTAKEHVREVCRKLGATSRLQAVSLARNVGLI